MHLLKVLLVVCALLHLCSGLPTAELEAVRDLCTAANTASPNELSAKWNCADPSSACSWPGIICSGSGDSETIVEIIGYYNCSFGGSFPASIGNLLNLTRLIFDSCSSGFVGALPDSLSKLRSLKSLMINIMELSGTIPEWNFTSLRELIIRDTLLTGSLPSWAAQNNYERLYLANNFLVGSIPDSWATMNTSTLGYLGLFGNALSGSLPAWLANLPACRELVLHTNRFTGTLPQQYGSNWPIMSYLDLKLNLLSGTLPLLLGNATRLLGLDLYNNSFTGTIPSELASISFNGFASPGILTLGYNNFTGTIPPTLEDKNYTFLNLQSLSNITGCVPRFNLININGNGARCSFDGTPVCCNSIPRFCEGADACINDTVICSGCLPPYVCNGVQPRDTFCYQGKWVNPFGVPIFLDQSLTFDNNATISGDVSIKGGSMTISSGVILNLTGNLNISQPGKLIVQQEGSVQIQGDLHFLPGSAVEVSSQSATIPPVTVFGCLYFDGSIYINTSALKPDETLVNVTLFNSNGCVEGNYKDVRVVSPDGLSCPIPSATVTKLTSSVSVSFDIGSVTQYCSASFIEYSMSSLMVVVSAILFVN